MNRMLKKHVSLEYDQLSHKNCMPIAILKVVCDSVNINWLSL